MQVVKSVPVPSVDSIRFRSVESLRQNTPAPASLGHLAARINAVPFFCQVRAVVLLVGTWLLLAAGS